jgi:hypothetical protein
MQSGERSLTTRCLALALLVGAPAVVWVVLDELVYATIEVGNSVPPIPAVAFLIALAGASALARRLGRRWQLSRAEMLLVYIFLTTAAAVPMVSCLGYLFTYLTVPRYIAAGRYQALAAWLPRWYAPASNEAVRAFFEGQWHGEPLPWSVWIVPLLAWAVFLIVLMATIYAALSLLRRTWQDQERLAYPMTQIPLSLIGMRPGARGMPPFWRDPLMWLGFSLTALFDGLNMLRAGSPSVPAPGTQYDLGSAFPDRPWSALAPIAISYRPEIFGLAYLMPTDVLLTAWVSYLLLRLSSVLRSAAGQTVASTAFDYQELGIGAFLGIAALLLYRAWPHVWHSMRVALGRERTTEDDNEPLSYRAAWGLLVGGSAFMLGWLALAGVVWWVAAAHLALLIVVAVVYARIRAEAGATSVYLFPFWQQQQLLVNLFGSRALMAGGSEGSLVAFASLGGLSRGVYPEVSACGAEGMGLAGYAGLRQRDAAVMALGGAAFGLLLGGLLYLVYYYRFGANLIDAGGGHGGWRIFITTQQYDQLARLLKQPALPRTDLALQTLLGGLLVVGLAGLRQLLPWFPLHPLGFAMASAYGFHLWAPFLAAWVCKVGITRWGGSAGYRRLMPLFLGIVLGRYLFTGLVWGILGLFGSPLTHTYRVHFS